MNDPATSPKPSRMKNRLGENLVLLAIGAGLGFSLKAFIELERGMHDPSLDAQTLTDISRALEEAKQKSGSYPESIKDLSVTSSGGDYADEVRRRVVYRRTMDGYIAIAGSPHVVYIEPGQPARME